MDSAIEPCQQKRQLSCSVPASEYIHYERDAAKRGLTLTDYVRHKLRDEPLPEPPDTDDE